MREGLLVERVLLSQGLQGQAGECHFLNLFQSILRRHPIDGAEVTYEQ